MPIEDEIRTLHEPLRNHKTHLTLVQVDADTPYVGRNRPAQTIYSSRDENLHFMSYSSLVGLLGQRGRTPRRKCLLRLLRTVDVVPALRRFVASRPCMAHQGTSSLHAVTRVWEAGDVMLSLQARHPGAVRTQDPACKATDSELHWSHPAHACQTRRNVYQNGRTRRLERTVQSPPGRCFRPARHRRLAASPGRQQHSARRPPLSCIRPRGWAACAAW